jgi:hypothetical protein
MNISVRVEGDGRVIANLDRAYDLVNRRGELSDIAQWMAQTAERYASGITHQDTATLWGSYIFDTSELQSHNRIYIHIDPSVVNPRGQRPVKYGPYEHARGGEHAFFRRTVNERGDFILEGGMNRIARGLRSAWR